MTYNCANLVLANQEIYQDNRLYFVDSLENRGYPMENLPSGWYVVSDQDVSNLFEISTGTSGKAYSIFNYTNAVLNDQGNPQYLVGNFEEA